jgi:hypothetical protein
MSSFDEVFNEENFKVFRLENNLPETTYFQKVIGADLIQFHFGIKGGGNFIFNQGNYVLPLKESSFLFLYLIPELFRFSFPSKNFTVYFLSKPKTSRF